MGEETEEIQQSRSGAPIMHFGLKHDPSQMERHVLESDIIDNIEHNDYKHHGDCVYKNKL
jgi:hypothetical protein